MADVDGPGEATQAAQPAPDAPPPFRPPRPFESRAAIVLKVLGAVGLLPFLAATGILNGPGDAIYKAILLAGEALLVAVALTEAIGLDRRRPWAVAAAVPLLLAIVVVSAGGALIGMLQGRLIIPLDVVLVVWAFMGSREAAPERTISRRGGAMVATYLAAAVATSAVAPAAAPGGFFDVHQTDLQASIQVDCGSRAAGPPSSIDLRYDWHWSRTTPFPSGVDDVAIWWSGQDGDGQSLYVLGDQPMESGAGIDSGVVEGDLTSTMPPEFADSGFDSWSWGVDLAEQRFASGHVSLRLVRAAPAPPSVPGPLLVQVAYVHLGVWRSDLAEAACSW